MTPAIEDVQVRAQAIADKLLGTCDWLHVVAPDAPEDPDLCEALDQLVSECTGCGWWFETHDVDVDVDDEGQCEDCQSN